MVAAIGRGRLVLAALRQVSMIDLFLGDCRAAMPARAPFDMLIADPPYGVTSLEWDRCVDGWERVARDCVAPHGSLWVFGSLKFLMATSHRLAGAGWRYAQDIVWEKHNGSSFHADRFKRVHEHAVQFYRDDVAWSSVYNEVQKTHDAVKRAVRSKGRPPHMGNIGARSFVSEDGGPRLMRSVIFQRSCHGFAIHPTEKPVALLEILIRTSCPPRGLVGDFFAGSGAAGEAAARCGRRYVGAEIDPVYHARASARFSSLVLREEAA